MLLIKTKGSLHRVKIKKRIIFHLFMQTMIIILLGVHAYRGAIGGVSKQLLDRRHGRGLRCRRGFEAPKAVAALVGFGVMLAHTCTD